MKLNNDLKVFRHEFKYFINNHEHYSLRNKLKILMKSDRHSDNNGNYHIRSLYFDDIYNTALYEKQAGILQRKKYRIRIYNLNDDVIKLEKKSRIGQFVNKESFILNRDQVNKIMSYDYSFLLKLENKLANEFYFDLKNNLFRPKVIVDYIREAYVLNFNNIRVTFDKHLKTGLESIDLFNKNLMLMNVIDEPQTIVEIKFSNMLPDYLKSALQIKSNQRLAISKYVYSRKFNKANIWEDQ
jgi:hypothetical protein